MHLMHIADKSSLSVAKYFLLTFKLLPNGIGGKTRFNMLQDFPLYLLAGRTRTGFRLRTGLGRRVRRREQETQN